MRLQSVLRLWPLAAIWSVICLILAIVGLLLVSEPSGNGDLLAAAATPSLTYGEPRFWRPSSGSSASSCCSRPS